MILALVEIPPSPEAIRNSDAAFLRVAKLLGGETPPTASNVNLRCGKVILLSIFGNFG